MLLTVAYILLTASQLGVSKTERNSTWQTEDWTSSQVKPQDGVSYVSDTKHSLHPSCHGTWTIAKEDKGNTSCECGSDLGGLVQCDDTCSKSFKLQLLSCYCMTPYGKNPNTTVVGACLYRCKYNHGRHYYSILANDLTSLSEFMCSEMDREGQLCGQCATDFSPPAYSYNWHCVNCSVYDGHIKQLTKYIAIAFLPLTVFFFIVTTLHISAASPSIHAFILVSQLITAPIILRTFIHEFVLHNITLNYNLGLFVLSLYSIWNLDFFRTMYPPFCLHPNISTLQVLALDYIIATYPLFLVIVTYIVVELHDRNFKIVVWLWKPVRRFFIYFRRYWNVKTSLIDAFGTFLLLSYVKFLSTSFDLLIPVNLFNMHGDTINETYLYYDATIEYFSKQHLPYAILAITVLILFNFLPVVLLCLYPCKCFHMLLNRCRLSCTALHTFMDTFQGCYKNRTDSSYDRRWFSAVYLIIRIAFHLLVAWTQDMKLLYFCIATLLIFTVILIGIVQPYKSPVYSRLDMVLILLLAATFLLAALTAIAHIEHGKYSHPIGVIAAICGTLPLMYIIAISMHWLLIRKLVSQRLCYMIWKRLPFKRMISQRNLEESLPGECTTLLQDPMTDSQASYKVA